MKSKKRFNNVLSIDYDLFKKAVPHHDDFQSRVSVEIKCWLKGKKASTINIVEIGTGTGITTKKIIEVDTKIKIITIDNEPLALKQARVNLKNAKDRITFIEKDALEALRSLSDESVDVVVSGYTIHNMPPKYRQHLFAEIYRALRRGSLFINADKIAHDDLATHRAALGKQIEDFSAYGNAGRQDLEDKWTKHYLEDEKIKITETEHINILQKIGFLEPHIIYRGGLEAIIIAAK